VIDSLEELLEVALPAQPPSRFSAMTWPDVRRCGANGATFGAHTVTHPILSRLDDQNARDEITTSWKRVQEETTAVSRVFCYPNGGSTDYTGREVRVLAEAGFTAAVTTVQDYAASPAYGEGRLFDLPRFPYPGNQVDFLQVVNGVERIKRSLRR
jgi:peptidoglycan/xylan/chitin deacetylase (PgdA/CDA1 family)